MTLKCGRADVFNSKWDAPLTFAYSGEAQGTLAVTGVLGNFTIPATKKPLAIEPDIHGEAIDGIADARVLLPALADLESCIDKKAGPDAKPPSDEYLDAHAACLQELAPSPEGVGAVAEIRLGISLDPGDTSGEDAFVVFKVRYADKSSKAPDATMSAELFPAKCVLQK
ncbi:hypothetical protein [Hyphomicrobium methylovorum]|uniref:hypothetical protein n=1 Tax=Hyphomicrobium methylovorum TaxID=84 RepID=UPI0015E66BF1|nr:hypothetical protein [Hyphomicrobium methylovorum]